MDPHTLRVLEFEKVKELLQGFTSSVLGREVVADLHPMNQRGTIQESLMEVTEMVRLYDASQAPPLDGLFDVRGPLRKSTISGAMLEPAEILLIGETLAAARRIYASARNFRVEALHIRRYCERLAPYPSIEDAIARVFDEQKNIRDSASSDLSKIRRSIRQQRAAIVHRLERLMRGGWRDYLQETFYTQRDGRFVLPVDARYQNKVPGIIHDRSSTGTTVYIEPMELVEDSNYLKNLIRDEELEVRRILCELTALIARHEPELQQNLQIFGHLDFVAAKARFSLRYEMCEPKLSEGRMLEMINARHPLLLAKHGRENVIPLSLILSPDVRGLVITGPNTGGKTVVLKTAGILVLMAQSGLHVPADANTELPVFESMGADIGDEQSLEQSLSTFSSHIQSIRNVLQTAGPRTLVLLDELGSGTDPMEGGALSCAILEQLHRQQATYIVTTHLQPLKIYAYQTDGVENGAMEFDLQSLKPTYRFQMGLPGKSNAIQISSRLGLPEAVIHRAQVLMESSGDSPEELLAKLGDELRTVRSRSAEAERERQKAQEFSRDAEQRMINARKEAGEVVKRSERKAQNLVHELERRLDHLEQEEAEFKRQWKDRLNLVDKKDAVSPPVSVVREARRDLQTAKTTLQEVKPKIEERFQQRRDWKWEQLQPGGLVQVDGLSEPGTVLRVFPDKKEAEITVSSMTLRIKGTRILAVLKAKPQPPPSPMKTVQVERPETVESKVDVHGMTVDEMTPIVERYIDQAFLGGLSTITIVHGYGMGILRQAVQRILKNNPVVRDYNLGANYEGGMGVTIVHLKSSR